MKLLRTLAHALIRRSERQLEAKLDYVHEIADTDFGLLMRYNKVFGFLDPRKNLPAEAYHAARIRGALAADCGTCVELEMTLARQAGLSDEVIDQILSQQATGALADVIAFTDSIVRDRIDNSDLRVALTSHYGKAGLIELSYAMNGAALLPSIKRAMGHAQSCNIDLMRNAKA